MEYNIAADETLLRATQYDLVRGSDRVPIRVREFVAGKPPKTKFIASPWLLKPGRDEFIGWGDTEAAALQDCLAKIKGVSFEQIFDVPDKQ
jgi:hypothetical protein